MEEQKKNKGRVFFAESIYNFGRVIPTQSREVILQDLARQPPLKITFFCKIFDDSVFWAKTALHVMTTKQRSWKNEAILATHTKIQPARRLPPESFIFYCSCCDMRLQVLIDNLHLNFSK